MFWIGDFGNGNWSREECGVDFCFIRGERRIVDEVECYRDYFIFEGCWDKRDWDGVGLGMNFVGVIVGFNVRSWREIFRREGWSFLEFRRICSVFGIEGVDCE